MKKKAILTAFWAGLVCVSLCSCRGAEDAEERGSLVSEAERVETEEIPQDEEDLQMPETPAEEETEQLTIEQRRWIADKERQMEEARRRRFGQHGGGGTEQYRGSKAYAGQDRRAGCPAGVGLNGQVPVE